MIRLPSATLHRLVGSTLCGAPRAILRAPIGVALLALPACSRGAAANADIAQAPVQNGRAIARRGDTVVVANVGLRGPENLVYDSVADVFLVSNVNGDPGAPDDNGFISRVSPGGEVLALKWVEGGRDGARLDAPKGLAIRGDTLAIADVGAVHYFERRTGRALGSVTLPGRIMNDVAYAADGSLYVTDTGPDRAKQPVDTSADMDAVYRVEGQGRVETVARGLALDRPDGIVVRGHHVVVATFGANRVERVGAGRQGPVTVAVLPGGRVDGLRRLPGGALLVSSWDAKAVYQIDGDSPHALLTGMITPAGVAVDTRRDRLAVSSMRGDRILIAPLPKAAGHAPHP